MAEPPRPAGRTGSRGGGDRGRQALRPRRSRRPPRARPRRLRARPAHGTLGADPGTLAARAPGCSRRQHARVCARRPQRGDRHEHEPVRGLRRADATVDAAGTRAAGPRRHRSGLREREDLLDRRRAPAGHDRVGLHVRAADEALAAPPRSPDSAPRARRRRRRGPCLGRRRRPAAGTHGQRRGRVDPPGPRSGRSAEPRPAATPRGLRTGRSRSPRGSGSRRSAGPRWRGCRSATSRAARRRRRARSRAG